MFRHLSRQFRDKLIGSNIRQTVAQAWPWGIGAEQQQDWRHVPWFAVDCETNGLNPEQDALLSLAWVPIEPPFIRLGAAEYAVLRHQAALNQSAVVHQLTRTELKQGEPLEQVLERFAQATRKAYVVAHYAAFDRAVLAQHFNKIGLTWQPLGWYDTLAATKRQLRQKGQLQQQNFTLAESRHYYQLPAFSGHHARNDAIACAELFLAQNYQHRPSWSKKPSKALTVKQVLRRGR